MKSKRRRRYKKKEFDLFLICKIALICYLATFGARYMSSDTSAYFSSQAEVSQTITAGIWEVPEVLVNACGEEYTVGEIPGEEIIDEVSSEEIVATSEENVDPPSIVESKKDESSSGEQEIDCSDKDDASKEKVEKDPIVEIDCKVKDKGLVEESEKDAASSEKVKDDCEIKDKKSNEEVETDKATGNVDTIDPVKEKETELEAGKTEAEKENANKTEVTDGKDESVNEKNDNNETGTEKASDEASENIEESNVDAITEEEKDNETNDAVKQEENLKEAEGDTND